MAVYYYVVENDIPSWGTGIIYYHVWLLRKNKYNAHILHDMAPYKLPWLKLDVSFRYISDTSLQLNPDDYLVIPEFHADLPHLLKFSCKKVVFVQNAFYIFDGLKNQKSYEDIGISQVFYIMPHIKDVLEKITSLPLFQIPPFIAPYFYNNNDNQRKRRIILYPKYNNRDYSILIRMLQSTIGLIEKKGFKKLLQKKNEWQIIELKNKKHDEVAEEMKQAVFFISLNTTEAFNSSVPEAMAAGCINICYEGVGPADFLANNKNAFVFSNNHIFGIVNKIIELVKNYDTIESELQLIRTSAKRTADKYKIDFVETSLLTYFGSHI